MSMTLTFDRKTLLLRVKQNRAIHKSNFEKASSAYWKKTIKAGERALRLARLHKDAPYEHETKPESHLEDYDRAIGMLTTCLDEKIQLTSQQYAMIVDDNWEWSREFHTSVSNYTTSFRKVPQFSNDRK